MKRVGLFLILILFFANKILAYPQSLGRIDEVQTIPMVLNAFGMKGSRLYIVDANKSELMIYDIAQGYWHASGIRVSSRRSIKDIYVDESRIHLLDAKNNSILSYDLQGTLINEIKTKGVKELNFKRLPAFW